MREKDHEEQLRRFFEHQETPLHLKKYVREHPTNKMAWYLLGREYDAQGKRSKALYCYTQAGEIYEAFENQAAPVSLESRQSLDEWERRGRGQHWLNRIRAAALAALVVIGIAYLPGVEPISLPSTTPPPAPALPQDVSPAQVQQTKVYYVTGGKTKDIVGAALQEMLIKERVNSYAILAYGKLTDDKKWISWLQPPDLLLSVEGKQDAAQQQILYHDAESCSCQPTDPSKAQAIYQSWAGQREQELVVRSAIASYAHRTGKVPDRLEALNQPYPQNVLSGVTPFMEQLYNTQKEQLVSELSQPQAVQQQPTDQSGKTGSGVPSATASGLIKPLTEPLRIVVDKTNHRLAVVSGQMIVRSYPVGLGGERTPEGTFEISEKVRNPNGKSNGDFGSRGMTLSDTLFAIHGTNKPSSVDKDQSLGCVRMLQDDIEELFDMVPLGTSVTIGKGLLPSEIKRGEPAFRLPLYSTETNPGKVYKWLD